MSARTQSYRDRLAGVVVCLIWLLAAVVDQANAEAWVPVNHAQLDAVFVEHSAALEGYHSVIVDPLSVWFGESNLAQKDLEAHLEAFRTAYASAFAQTFATRGLQLVENPGPGVLRVHVEIVDLMVNGYSDDQLEWAEQFAFPTAPDHLTLVAELSDASTGAVVVRVADLGRANDGQDVWGSVRESFESWGTSLAGVITRQGEGPAFVSR